MIETYKLTSGIYDSTLPNLLHYNKDTRMGGHNKNYPNRDVIRTFEPTSLLSVLLQHGTNYQIVLSMHQPCNHSKIVWINIGTTLR
jgi:hypothetical protein